MSLARRTRTTITCLLAVASAVLVGTTASAGASAVEIGFEDVGPGHPHRTAIGWIAARGITHGCSERRYCPEQAVTREQMASFLARAFELPASTARPFTDVSPASTHAASIAAIAAAGVTRGVTPTRFAPSQPVRRDQMASFLASVLGLETTSARPPFADVGADSVHAPSIAALAAAGITEGRSAGAYAPSASVSRAQMATFVRRALEFDTPIDTSRWPDADDSGVPEGTALQASGSVTTSRDGQVIQNLSISGSITVRHDNVTIRRVRVRSTGDYGISVPAGVGDQVDGLVIEDSTINGVSGGRSAGIAPYGRWTARRVDVSGFADGVKMGSGQTLADSWIHDLHGTNGSHNDAIQVASGRDIVIRGNRLEGPWRGQTSAIIVQTNNGPISGITIEDNLLSGGTYTVYLRDKGNGNGAPRDVTVRGNVWMRGSWAFGPVSSDVGTGWTWTGNRTDAGSVISRSG